MVGELWHWQVQQTLSYWTRRRRVTLITVLALVLAYVIAVAVLLLPARADLHPVRSADELTTRYGGTYQEEMRRHPDHAATST